MKLKIKELNFETGKFNLRWWHWVIGLVTTILITFKNEISRFI